MSRVRMEAHARHEANEVLKKNNRINRNNLNEFRVSTKKLAGSMLIGYVRAQYNNRKYLTSTCFYMYIFICGFLLFPTPGRHISDYI